MIPLRDENPVLHRPYVTIALILINFVVFLIWEPGSGPWHQTTEFEQTQFFYCHALVPYEVIHHTSLAEARDLPPDGKEAVAQLQLDRACPHKSWLGSVFVSMFLHGGWLHILGNMLFLWVFGNNVEDKLRAPLYLLFYLASGVAATLTQVALIHSGVNAFVPNLGASGAIAGVLGAYVVMFPRRRVYTIVIFF